MKERSPYRATRSCPHRLCPVLHLGILPIGVVVVAQTLFTGLLSVLYMAAVLVAVLLVLRVLDRRSFSEQVVQERLERAAGVQLVVRPVWAWIAAGLDALFLLAGGLMAVLLFEHPHTSSVPSSPGAGYQSLAVTVGLMWFDLFAHRQATRPVRPKRASVPALGDTA
jgi:hypothetical protein